MEHYCQVCGASEEEKDIYETADGKWLCDDCLTDNDYVICEVCGKHHPFDEVHAVIRSWGARTPEYICEGCLEDSCEFFWCEDCQEWYSTNHKDECRTHCGRTICYSCYEESYKTCEDCGGVFHEDEGEWDDSENYWYCNSCGSKRKVIRGYYYKPSPIFKSKHDTFYVSKSIKELVFGVENEIDKGDNPLDTASEICAISEDVYIKHDGSLEENGMEIVTHPCTLEYHMEDLGWDKICKAALQNGYTSHDARTCGLHVHVGRNQLSDNSIETMDIIAKIILLVDRHWEPIVKFSRRTERQLENWAKRPEINYLGQTERELINEALNTKNDGRYQAVNLQNYETIEFRIFNGTLKHTTILATLQFVSNICLYAKNNTTEAVLASKWEDITNYKIYSELQEYLQARGLETVETPKPVELAEEVKTKLDNYKVGDWVEIVNYIGDSVPALKNAIGRVAKIISIEPSSDLPITLAFSSPFSGSYGYKGYENTYMVKPRNIMHTKVLDF